MHYPNLLKEIRNLRRDLKYINQVYKQPNRILEHEQYGVLTEQYKEPIQSIDEEDIR